MRHEQVRETAESTVGQRAPVRSAQARGGPRKPPSTALATVSAEVARASESLFSGPTRIRMASTNFSPAGVATVPTAAAAPGRGDVIIQRRIDQTYAQFVQNQPPGNTDGQNTSAYLTLARNELRAVRARLPDGEKYLITPAEGLLTAAIEGARQLGRNATPAQLQQFRTDFVEPLVDEINRIDDQLTSAANAAAAAEALRVQQEQAARDAWAYEAADYGTPVPANAAADLRTLLDHAGGQFFKSKIGTIVGGRSAKSGKRIDGVAPGARLDVQSPPKKNLFNIQYQVDGWSYAGALFASDDDPHRVEAELLESLRRGQVAVSPAYQERR